MSRTEAIRRPVAALRAEGELSTLGVVSAGWFLALGMRLVFPAVLPYIRADLGIDNATAGLLVTLLWLSYALTQFPSGILSDRFGEGRILVASMLVGSLSLVGLWVSADFVGVVAMMVLYGLSTGFYATPRVVVVSDVFGDRATTALGIVFASGNVGNTLLPAAVGLLAISVGWRVGFLLAAPLFVVSAASLHWTLATTTRTDEADDPLDDTATESMLDDVGAVVVEAATELRRRPAQIALLVLILFAFAYQGFIGFLTTYLVEVKGVAPELTSLMFGSFFAAGLVAQLASGVLADSYGRRGVLLATLLVTVVGVTALTAVSSVAALAVIVALLGTQLAFWPVANAYAFDALSEGARGGGFGFIRTVYLCLGATGPLFVGWLFDAARYDLGYLLLVGVFVLVVGVVWVLPPVDPSGVAAEADGD